MKKYDRCKHCKHFLLCELILAFEQPKKRKEACKEVGGFKKIDPMVIEITVEDKEENK